MTVVAAAALVVLAAPVKASACDVQADYSSWYDNCTVGYGYDTRANYITGIQRILKGLGFYGGSVDGLWGPLSDGATRNYQSSRGLVSDGIVGPNTWGSLDNEIIYCTYGSPYKYYKAPGESCAGSFRRSTTGSNLWYIRKLNWGWQTGFSLLGPS